MTKLLPFLFLFTFPLLGHAEEMTVSQCAAMLSRGLFDVKEEKAKEVCKKYSQKSINCAIELVKKHRLSYTLETALEDCDRERSRD